MTALELGDGDRLQVGDCVLAIANPFGFGQKVTSGIVSASRRNGLNIESYEAFIQTDTSINPDNLTPRSSHFRAAILGIGFAVPANMADASID